MPSHPTTVDFFSADTLLEHIATTMRFYHPRCIDPSGGFYHYFKDDGTVYNHHHRHLVSSTRFVFNYAMAYRQFNDPAYLEQVRHGVRFLREIHRDPITGGYAWQLEWRDGEKQVTDADNHCYGLAFVVLAYAHAVMAGVSETRTYLDDTVQLMDDKFWSTTHGLYADQASADWQHVDPYRGQNANMHACEALLAAYHATGTVAYLHKAELLAHNITQRQAGLAQGMIWEHYDPQWQIDWNYNLHDKANLFRPWGYQPGHFTEWAKLLVLLEAERDHLLHDSHWMIPTAEHLFNTAIQYAWDKQHGGICYGVAPDLTVCDSDKYFWVQAESLAAAALLAQRTEQHHNQQHYRDWYSKIWNYSWQHMIDHQHGAWFRMLSRDNQKYSDEKSPAGKTDYHTMGACYDVLKSFSRTPSGVTHAE
ncbi:AGE family epimerase/isomerase [Undibacterium sp. RuRC25W]|uniref:AGE family epimerase/isomerase n=1 Tax=Undibacterium sp. RuRC25W TaxID=3413047 RepID=UPI003BF1A7F8